MAPASALRENRRETSQKVQLATRPRVPLAAAAQPRVQQHRPAGKGEASLVFHGAMAMGGGAARGASRPAAPAPAAIQRCAGEGAGLRPSPSEPPAPPVPLWGEPGQGFWGLMLDFGRAWSARAHSAAHPGLPPCCCRPARRCTQWAFSHPPTAGLQCCKSWTCSRCLT